MTNPVNRDTLVLTPEEEQIEKDIDAWLYKPVPNEKDRIKQLQKIAAHSIEKKNTTSISMRWENELLELVKKAAAEKHLPYQTFIKSVVHEKLMAI